MAARETTPSWSQQSNASSQRAYVRTNARAKRLRRDATPTEKHFWKALRQLNREGAHFRRQVALTTWVFDFGDLSARLLIEVDGGVHERLVEVAARDVEKTAWAAANGFRLLRFRNEDVWCDLDAVVETVRTSIQAPHPLPPPHKGEGK